MRQPALLLVAVAAWACGPRSDIGRSDTTAMSADSTPLAATRVGAVSGLRTPESVLYDAESDRFYVSNVDGNPSEMDGRAMLLVVHAESLSVVDTLAAGGHRGVTLNAPKGMIRSGDTLWVADINTVRAFSTRTGQMLEAVDLTSRGATFLNDVAIGPDGALYVTDTGIRFDATGSMTHPGTDRLFRIKGDSVSEVATGEGLQSPNGIAWDGTRRRWIIAPFGGEALLTLAPGAAAPDTLARGPGEYDGLVVLDDGRILVTSWADSAVFMVAGDSMRVVVPNVSAPADIGFDSKRQVLAVPRFESNAVEFYRIP